MFMRFCMIIKLRIISQGGFVSPGMLLLAMMILSITKSALFLVLRAAISSRIFSFLLSRVLVLKSSENCVPPGLVDHADFNTRSLSFQKRNLATKGLGRLLTFVLSARWWEGSLHFLTLCALSINMLSGFIFNFVWISFLTAASHSSQTSGSLPLSVSFCGMSKLRCYFFDCSFQETLNRLGDIQCGHMLSDLCLNFTDIRFCIVNVLLRERQAIFQLINCISDVFNFFSDTINEYLHCCLETSFLSFE